MNCCAPTSVTFAAPTTGPIHVHGKGGKDRRIPIEPPLVQVLERYLDIRASSRGLFQRSRDNHNAFHVFL